jgi:putative ABC transport system permease protein
VTPSLLRSDDAFVRDLRFAMRALWRAKGLAATVVVTLALDIRDNAAIFSVVRGVLLRPSSIATRIG